MPYDDLRSFIHALEQQGQLHRVTAEVDRRLEISEIADRVVKAGGPALLFERVKGFGMPVAANLFGSAERVKKALGVDDLDQLGRDVAALIEAAAAPGGWRQKMGALPHLRRLLASFPRRARSAPCQEVVHDRDPSLAILPVLHCWPGDPAPFITMPLVFTRDPATGRRNVGMYRMQVFDDRTTGMHWHIHKDAAAQARRVLRAGGERLEAAVVIGGDPATVYAATLPLPPEVDELLVAGFLRRRGVEVTRCRTVDLAVPARAEIVLEGYVDLVNRRIEGPFGDHTGFYSPAEPFPVFHLTCLTHRRDPVYLTTIVGKPPMEDYFMGKATERMFLPLLRMTQPEVVDMNFPMEGVFHNCVVISIRKEYPGQARKVMHAVWGTGQLMYTKQVIIVDEDVDVQDLSEVWFRVFSNVDPKRDVVLSEGPLETLDHSSPNPLLGSKMGIDATTKGALEGHPRDWPAEIAMDPRTVELVERRWAEYGLEAFRQAPVPAPAPGPGAARGRT